MPEDPNNFEADNEASDLRRDAHIEVGTEARGVPFTDMPESKVISVSPDGCVNSFIRRKKTPACMTAVTRWSIRSAGGVRKKAAKPSFARPVLRVARSA